MKTPSAKSCLGQASSVSHFLPVPALPQGRKHIQGLCPLRRVIKDSCFANIVDKVLLELKLLVFKVEKGMSFPQVDRSSLQQRPHRELFTAADISPLQAGLGRRPAPSMPTAWPGGTLARDQLKL